MRLFARRRGQIVIPALFVFPSLMLFVFLIYETAKLSREKIRHQFAIDAAAFVEMTNYSDFLNRTAYVNGPFPMRIFDEGFKSICIDCDLRSNCRAYPPCSKGKSLWDILWENGAFPRPSDKMKTDFGPNDNEWEINFGGGTQKAQANPSAETTLELIDKEDANGFWINWDDANNVYKLYVQIYSLLGSVEEAQWSVLTRLSEKQSFFKKSYWLNTGDPIGDADDGATAFANQVGYWDSSVAQPICHSKIFFYGNQPTGSGFQPWQLYAPQAPVALQPTIKNCSQPGLFQLMYVKTSTLQKVQGPPSDGGRFARSGVGIKQHWTAPKNFWGHEFNTARFDGGKPWVHVTVGLGPRGRIWPNPTPKFQVRTYP